LDPLLIIERQHTAQMKSFAVLLIACAFLPTGCQTSPPPPSGKVAVEISTLLGLQGSSRDFRIQIDGRFVGNYQPDGNPLPLPAGKHLFVVELPEAYEQRPLPNGGMEVWTYTLRGEEGIEVLGGAVQKLVFNADNLKMRRKKGDNGH
jgi:hypothetical protein